MACAYILRGTTGRYYIGSTDNLERRLNEHKRGNNHTTRRFGATVQLIVAFETATIAEARKLERALKRNKNPRLAIEKLRRLAAEE